jgi:hypothetical protein
VDFWEINDRHNLTIFDRSKLKNGYCLAIDLTQEAALIKLNKGIVATIIPKRATLL